MENKKTGDPLLELKAIPRERDLMSTVDVALHALHLLPSQLCPACGTPAGTFLQATQHCTPTSPQR